MKLAEEKRKKRFMEARGGSVGEGYVRVNGEWVKKERIVRLEINSLSIPERDMWADVRAKKKGK